VVENSAVLLYAAAGAGDDWAKGGAGIELAYTVELPDGGLPIDFYIFFYGSFEDYIIFRCTLFLHDSRQTNFASRSRDIRRSSSFSRLH